MIYLEWSPSIPTVFVCIECVVDSRLIPRRVATLLGTRQRDPREFIASCRQDWSKVYVVRQIETAVTFWLQQKVRRLFVRHFQYRTASGSRFRYWCLGRSGRGCGSRRTFGGCSSDAGSFGACRCVRHGRLRSKHPGSSDQSVRQPWTRSPPAFRRHRQTRRRPSGRGCRGC